MTTPLPPRPDQSPEADADGLTWTETGAPRSRRFGDIYFSPEDGLAESRAVFLTGCGLPDAWTGRSRFVVGELGFGAGLNILALFELWRRTRPTGAHLHVFSIEAFPLSRDDAARALAPFIEVSDLAALLLARWPAATPGFHRIDFPELGAVLDLVVMDVETALAEWGGRADAWFLDGFAPSVNPRMWTPAVMAAVAAKSAPGACLATFTVAGAVRRGLAEQGFSVEKAPGHGRKKERLEARAPGDPAREPPPPKVAVIGAGIAGAALVRAFRALGAAPVVIASAPGASENPAAMVSPRFDASDGPAARLHAQAFERAGAAYAEIPEAVLAAGVLRLEDAPRDASRFDTVAASPLFGMGALERLPPEAAGAALGEPSPVGGVRLRDGLVVEPAAVLSAWLRDAPVIAGEVAGLQRDGAVWKLLDAGGGLIAEAEAVVIAGGAGTGALAGIPLRLVRGQVSSVSGTEPPTPSTWGGYVVPTRDGLLFGATHDRDDVAVDVRDVDHARNLATLAERRPVLAAALAGSPLAGRAGVRASARDHLPAAGGLEDGLFVLSALGGRGFTLAPLMAEHVVALMLGAPSPLPASLAARLAPSRLTEPRGRSPVTPVKRPRSPS